MPFVDEQIAVDLRRVGPCAAGGGLVVDLTGMKRILDVRPADLQADVECGVVYAELNRQLRPSGLFFPPSPLPGSRITKLWAVWVTSDLLSCTFGVLHHDGVMSKPMRIKPGHSDLERRFLAAAPPFLRRGLLLGGLVSFLGAGMAAVVGRLWPALAGLGLGFVIVLGFLIWVSLRTHFPPSD